MSGLRDALAAALYDAMERTRDDKPEGAEFANDGDWEQWTSAILSDPAFRAALTEWAADRTLAVAWAGVPEGCRLVLVTADLLDTLGGRTLDGRRLSYVWNDPQPEGWYVPTITATDDGAVLFPSRAALTEAVAEALASDPDFPPPSDFPSPVERLAYTFEWYESPNDLAAAIVAQMLGERS